MLSIIESKSNRKMPARSTLRDVGTLSSKELGEPELGFLVVISADFPAAEGFGPT
jgi:hypothetical protein